MKGSKLTNILIGFSALFILNSSLADYIASPCPKLFILPQWGPVATVGGMLSTTTLKDQEQNAFKFVYGNFLVPVMQDDNSMVYIDGRQTVESDCCNFITNLGGGYRRIINNSYILGGYAFFDYQRTGENNNFYQGQLGGEYISPTWQARINGYVPVGDRNQPTTLGPNVNDGNQPIIFPGSLAVIEYPFSEHVEAGGDIQVGSLLPVAPSIFPFVGYYHFGFGQDQDLAINGGRAGIEYTYNRWLTLFGGDQYDNLRKNTVLIGANVTLWGGARANYSTNPLDSLMEQSPYGFTGLY